MKRGMYDKSPKSKKKSNPIRFSVTREPAYAVIDKPMPFIDISGYKEVVEVFECFSFEKPKRLPRKWKKQILNGKFKKELK